MVCLRLNPHTLTTGNYSYNKSLFKVDQVALPQIICCFLHR